MEAPGSPWRYGDMQSAYVVTSTNYQRTRDMQVKDTPTKYRARKLDVLIRHLTSFFGEYYLINEPRWNDDIDHWEVMICSRKIGAAVTVLESVGDNYTS